MTERDAQFFDQVGGLLERHVAIRVAMDQQQRGGRQFAMLATGFKGAPARSMSSPLDVVEDQTHRLASQAAPSVSKIIFVSARALSTFPSQHHSVAYGQADILNARVGLNETVKGDDGVIISVLGIYHFAAPQNIVGHDQPARFE